MTIIAARSDLLAWSSRQPPEITAQGNIIARNLARLKREPANAALLTQTTINIARLEKAKRLVKTAERGEPSSI